MGPPNCEFELSLKSIKYLGTPKLVGSPCYNVQSRKWKIIYELQKNEKTFLEEIDASLQQQYECWLDIIDDGLNEDRLSKHLVNSPTLHNQYLKLVPDHVSHQFFWKRYLFKKALLEDELAREEAVEKKLVKEKESAEEFKWDHEDFSADVELSEEEQIRLLQEYEEETKQKIKTKPTAPGEQVNSNNKTIVETSIEPVKNIKGDQVVKADVSPVSKENHYGEPEKNLSAPEDKKIDFTNSLELETKSSNSSSDGDWEKVNDTDK